MEFNSCRLYRFSVFGGVQWAVFVQYILSVCVCAVSGSAVCSGVDVQRLESTSWQPKDARRSSLLVRCDARGQEIPHHRVDARLFPEPVSRTANSLIPTVIVSWIYSERGHEHYSPRCWLQIIVNYGSHRHSAGEAGGIGGAVLLK